MKTFIALLLTAVMAVAQSKQWTGTSTRIWPAQHPSAVIIDGNGTNTLTINRTPTGGANRSIMRLQQSSTNVVTFWPDGSASYGRSTLNQWGDLYSQFGMFTPMASYLDTRNGDPAEQQIYLVGTDGSIATTFDLAVNQDSQTYYIMEKTGPNSYFSRVRVNTDDYGGGAYVDVRNGGGAATKDASARLSAIDNKPQLTLSGTNGFFGVFLGPGEAATATPFKLDTKLSHTAGNLLEIYNLHTLEFSFSYDGKVTTAAPTGGSAGAWKLGTASAGTFTADKIIEVEIDGTVYQIPARIKP